MPVAHLEFINYSKLLQFICRLTILATRKVVGYHDEPLLGQRSGQRSIRLSKSYRAIYIEMADNKLRFIEIIEVNQHEY